LTYETVFEQEDWIFIIISVGRRQRLNVMDAEEYFGVTNIAGDFAAVLKRKDAALCDKG
jgi:hypothetical protein